MPLNIKKAYSFVPTPVGPVKLRTRSARRSRALLGGTYFRSLERGEAANLIKLIAVEDLTNAAAPEGLFVVQHTVLKPDEMIFAVGMPIPVLELFELNLGWDEELRIFKDTDGAVRAVITGISWQIARSERTRVDLGVIRAGRVLVLKDGVSLKLTEPAVWPPGAAIVLRPRTHRYPLVLISNTDPTTSISATGWDPGALRAAVNDVDTWIKMPWRAAFDPNAPAGGTPPANEDVTDMGVDDAFVTAFPVTAMSGGDGLPAAPAGLNTGPDRVLVHLNYSELEDGSLGELNQVFEWVGSSAAVGSWGRYA